MYNNIIKRLRNTLNRLQQQLVEAEENPEVNEEEEAARIQNEFGNLFTNTTGHSIGAIKGQFVWVFFEGGDHMHPVYFASCPAGESWGSKSAGTIVSNTRGLKKMIDESIFVDSREEVVKEVEKSLDKIDNEDFAEFTVENIQRFPEMKTEEFTEFVISKDNEFKERIKDIEVKKQEFVVAFQNKITKILEELPEDVSEGFPEKIVKFKEFMDGLTKTYSMFGFTDEEEFNESLSILAIATIFNPTLTSILSEAVKPLLEQIVGTNFRLVFDRDGKPTLNIIFGGNIKLMINGNIELLQNGSITTFGTGNNSIIAPTNTMIPPPITLPMLAALGLEFETEEESASGSMDSASRAGQAWKERWNRNYIR